MVTRKPLRSGAQIPSSLPYPTSPTENNAPAFAFDASQDSRPEAENVWAQEDKVPHSLPPSLQVGSGRKNLEKSRSRDDIPEALKVGSAAHTPRSSGEIERPSSSNTNPFLRKQNTTQDGSNDGRESSAGAWGSAWNGAPSGRPPIPTNQPPPPPVQNNVPSAKLAELSVNEPSTNPWQPALDEKPLSSAPSHIPIIQREDSGNAAWTSEAPAPMDSHPLTPPAPLARTDSEESFDWNDERTPAAPVSVPTNTIPPGYEEEHGWEEEEEAPNITQDASVAAERAAQEDYLRQKEDGWVEPQGSQENGTIEAPVEPAASLLERQEEHAPALPPRRKPDAEPLQAPRLAIDTHTSSTTSLETPGSSGSAIEKQKKETYEIKKISWHDVTSKSNPRISPILVQNANGPCPLLALVNALTLSTPAGVDTALIETLRSREQVSLGLLLDAVFDELMSGRRGDAAHGLPDVSELYSFLITLHTGMNVNPRFLPPAPTSLLDDIPAMPDSSSDDLPGTFENTREMKLYSTFSVPLIHGWLPQRGEAAFAALSRSAQSYEDAQHLRFREEELEDKLQREGLSFEEQATLEDIATITAFLNSSATQLTQHGLDTIRKHLKPGSIAILFRNDHFSTLYRHPTNHQLLQLVTDLGYSTHDEIVWESLSDVSGLNCEFLSGDFRLVSGGPSRDQNTSPTTSNSGWTTVQHNNSRHQASASTQSIGGTLAQAPSNDYEPPRSHQNSSTEQEDHDLALALQLQEEEEERHRSETARRQRETELSQQYIESQQGQQGQQDAQRPARRTSSTSNAIPVTRTRTGTSQSGSSARPAVPARSRQDPEAGVDIPPPSYEQAASEQEYIPPANHPAHPESDPSSVGSSAGTHQRRPSGFGRATGNGRGSTIGGIVTPMSPGARRRPNDGAGGMNPAQAPKDKDCVVM